MRYFVPLDNFFYFCRPMTDTYTNNSASGYLSDSFEGISRVFTDVEVLSTSEVNVMARGKRYGRWWMLKALRLDVAAQASYQQRLRKEFEILVQMEHPGVAGVVGLEYVDVLGECIVMEYVDGKSLTDWLKDNPDRKRRRKVAYDLLVALAYVHSKNIVHRDLKPENIMIARNGDAVKLIDFGLADTDSHAVLKQPAGSIGYISPEQMQTAVADVRNDIYSLGVIFAQMNVGYKSIIKKCLRPIDARYRNVAQLQSDLQKRDKRRLHLGICIIVGVIVILAGGFLWQTFRIEAFEHRTAHLSALNAQLSKLQSTLTDSIHRIHTAYDKLNEEQEQQRLQWLKIEKAIADGNAVADKALAKTHLLTMMDTLRYKNYGTEAVTYGSMSVNEAVDDYIERQRQQFSETELAEISTAVFSHTSYILKPILDKMNSLPWLNH